MKRVFLLVSVSFFGAALLVGCVVASSRSLSFNDVRGLLASVFFVDSITVDGLKEKYAAAGQGGEKVRVLIVPGHDTESWGTEFRGVREADMTAEVGAELSRLLSGDPHFEPTLSRTREEYVKEFREYFREKQAEVRAFVANRKQVMKDLMKADMARREVGVIHNVAPTETAARLYAVNRWANEHGIDIVLHLHFNDYPGRPRNREGRYDGFAVYVPEEQYSNARASRAVGEALFAQFSKFYSASNFPLEEGGIVPDQDLIAVGAYNTLDAAGALIEYGYIYEERFKDPLIRAAFLKELALQTYLGLTAFFGGSADAARRFPTTFLPHEWLTPLSQGVVKNPSVLSLQAALLFENAYPPEGDKRACPLTGSFGPCTRRAVARFQERNGIGETNGAAGALTLAKLNEKYGR